MGQGRLSKVSPKAMYALGTPEEVDHRDKVGFQPGGKAFKQLDTGVSSRDANKPGGPMKDSAFKFSNGV